MNIFYRTLAQQRFRLTLMSSLTSSPNDESLQNISVTFSLDPCAFQNIFFFVDVVCFLFCFCFCFLFFCFFTRPQQCYLVSYPVTPCQKVRALHNHYQYL